jgi:hypothetical protein
MNIKGGLGNQIFQYAFANYLESLSVNIDYFFLDYQFDTYQRGYLLDQILKHNIPIIKSLPDNCVKCTSEHDISIIHYLQSRTEGAFLIDGYFQNIKYLERSKIMQELNFLGTRSELTALHLRRYDYGHHGCIKMHYYLQALEELKYPDFVVYSDEYNFSSHVFSKVKGFQYVKRPNLINPISDFTDMVNSNNIVMANSTFSWLVAYISYIKFNTKIVYPLKWSNLNDKIPGAMVNWMGLQNTLINP